MIRTSAAWLIFVCFAASAALADRVVLENGNVLEGRAERRDGQVVIRSALGTIAVSAQSVVRIEREVPRESELLRLLEEARTVEELLLVAERCRLAGADTLARRAYERVLRLEPEHELARAQLGYRRVEESWTLEPVAPTARPRGMSRAERDLVAALLAASAPQPQPAPSPVAVPALAWPPVGVFGPGVSPTPPPSLPAPPPPTVAPPSNQAPVLRARRATRGRFAGSP